MAATGKTQLTRGLKAGTEVGGAWAAVPMRGEGKNMQQFKAVLDRCSKNIGASGLAYYANTPY